MYCPADRVSNETGGRCSDGRLGIWGALVPIGTAIIGSIGGDGSGWDRDEYYAGVRAGRLMCPGPYNIQAVAGALDRNPEFEAEFDRELSADAMWANTRDNRTRASALVNWTHGGINCEVTGGEALFGQTIDRLLEADKRKAAAQLAAQAAQPTTTIAGVEIPTPASATGFAVWAGLAAAAVVVGVTLTSDRPARI